MLFISEWRAFTWFQCSLLRTLESALSNHLIDSFDLFLGGRIAWLGLPPYSWFQVAWVTFSTTFTLWFSCFSHALRSFGLGVAARLKALFRVFLKRSTASSRGTYLLMVKCWISWTVSRIFGASALDQSIPSIFLYLNIILLECLFIYLTKKAVSRRSPPKSIRTYSIVFSILLNVEP